MLHMKSLVQKKLKQLLQAYKDHKLLLTVSGGKDSMTLMHILKDSPYDMAVAHCNFQLRGEAADEDEQLVKKYAQQYGFTLHSKRFDTLAYVKQKKVSIEMAARELRYTWFESLCRQHAYSHILTAHHKNDQVETFFINLNREAGIRGLSGMSYLQGNILRPMLNCSQEDIINYVEQHQLPYREDDTNKDNIHLRNAIRNQLIPICTQINPHFVQSAYTSIEYLQGASSFIQEQMGSIKQALLNTQYSVHKLDTALLLKKFPSTTAFVLSELLRDYNFKGPQLKKILSSITQDHVGKQFYSASHRLILDRNELLIETLDKKQDHQDYFLDLKHLHIETERWKLTAQISDTSKLKEIPKSADYAALDLSKISFPLHIRIWKAGDTFQPLGMKGKKKVSDFLIDNKLSLLAKESTKVLCSNDVITWLIGHRIADPYKISKQTHDILLLHYEEKDKPKPKPI